MQLKSLKVFCDIVGRRSFSRAADENGISQSGASQMVHHLEEYLGVKLIDRSKRPFVLTPEGEVYYEGCRNFVQRYYSMEEEVRSLHAEVSGRVNVASIYSVGLSHMSRFVQDYIRQHPKANVRLQYQHPDRVYELIASGVVDIGLVSYARDSRTIQADAWRQEPMVIVCSPKHRLAQREAVALRDLDGQTFIGFDENLRIRHETDRTLSARGIQVDVTMEFDNIETLKRAIEINAGVGLLPEPTVAREVAAGTLVAWRPADVELFRPLAIVRRRGVELGKTASRFIQLLLEQSQEENGECEADAAVVAGQAPTGQRPGRHSLVK